MPAARGGGAQVSRQTDGWAGNRGMFNSVQGMVAGGMRADRDRQTDGAASAGHGGRLVARFSCRSVGCAAPQTQ